MGAFLFSYVFFKLGNTKILTLVFVLTENMGKKV